MIEEEVPDTVGVVQVFDLLLDNLPVVLSERIVEKHLSGALQPTPRFLVVLVSTSGVRDVKRLGHEFAGKTSRGLARLLLQSEDPDGLFMLAAQGLLLLHNNVGLPDA